jgi:phosphoglycerate-specific signal transduction histidine kinase
LPSVREPGSIAAATKLNDELEQRVIDRTAELVKVNEELQEEMEQRQRAEEELRGANISWLKANALATRGAGPGTSLLDTFSGPTSTSAYLALKPANKLLPTKHSSTGFKWTTGLVSKRCLNAQ